jgi:hypothetical protein
VIAATALIAIPAHAAKRMTNFNPRTHGFNFINSFNNDVVKSLDVRTGGLCGGMVYSALDYYHASTRPVPRQDFRPANRTPLQSYIYGRQTDSLVPNLTKWGEIRFNPRGARNNEFFRWGLTSELRNLKEKIDRGQPVPLGLKGHNRGDHQVLAIGYTTGASDTDLRIHLYDPNRPNLITTMRPSMRDHLFVYEGLVDRSGKSTHNWRTYFVDKSYRAKAPLNLRTPRYPNDAFVREIVVQFDTGDDNLRGGNDNVSLIVHLKNGTNSIHHNINRSAHWLRNYTEYAQVRLAKPIHKNSIKGFEFKTTFRGGIGGDNWDAKRIVVCSNLGTTRQQLTQRASFNRFTGSRRSVMVDMPGVSRSAPPTRSDSRGMVTHLQLEIKTGGDDLRGSNDNLNVIVLYRSGRTQVVSCVNARQKWKNNSRHTVNLPLHKPVNRVDIIGITLQTTFRGGTGGDNWNMDEIKVCPVMGGDPKAAYVTRSGRPVKRFTGSSKSYSIRW